ncbi:hypothetical protein PTQ50_26830 [Klebsiella michiganensis]|uniref:Pectate lyase superfamily protein domain-containing protein n=4 Tax=Klebsiella TaxID=570 RepID=A0AB35WBD1_9ENTR|nr:hypothetical protein [Klebsiella michiganensis]MBS6123464.1 hypothetical protein [Veillonella sp.]ELT9742784.1 hypothetical protein [Klebsiella michiganensis]EMB9092587.1 hypothetical protein [Klebsiella michiganensis]EMD5183836.1 hypothetical protein [Klebsiella michiganensis]MBA7859301.1 hypothetical protein [Klebsiella michiganensis]
MRVLSTDDNLREDLSSSEEGKGSSLVAHRIRTIRERFYDEVSVLDFGTADKYGTAMMAAIDFVMEQGGGTIFVPGRSYILDTTIEKTLTADIHIRMSNGANVNIKKAMDVYSITSGNNQFIIENGKTTVAILETDYTHAVVRMSGKTLQQNIKVVGHTFRRLNNFNLGFFVYGEGLNAAEFLQNHISAAVVPYHLESSSENSNSRLIANAMEAEITGNKIYNAANAIEVINKGYYGCEGVRIKNNIMVCSKNAITVIADSSLRAAYMPPLFQITGNHINAYRALYAEKISRLFFTQNDIQAKFKENDEILGVIEIYSTQGWTITNNIFSAVSQDTSAKSNINPPIYLGKLDPALPNAYGTIDTNTFWLDGMVEKAISFESLDAYTGQSIKYGINIIQSLSAIISRAYRSKIIIAEMNSLTAYDAAEGLAYSSSDSNYTYDVNQGILYIKGRSPARNVHIISKNVLPDGSIINQIVAENTYGKQLIIRLTASEITIVHGANLIAPDQKTTKLWLPTYIIVEFLNNQQCQIVATSGISSRPVVSSNPTTGARGSTGDEYYDSQSGLWKKYFPGVGWRVISTMENK